MRTHISLIQRIVSILDRYESLELVYLKTDKDDRTDVTFMTTKLTDELILFLKNRLHPYNIIISTMNWPINDGTSVKIELYDINI